MVNLLVARLNFLLFSHRVLQCGVRLQCSRPFAGRLSPVPLPGSHASLRRLAPSPDAPPAAVLLAVIRILSRHVGTPLSWVSAVLLCLSRSSAHASLPVAVWVRQGVELVPHPGQAAADLRNCFSARVYSVASETRESQDDASKEKATWVTHRAAHSQLGKLPSHISEGAERQRRE